VEDQQQQIVYLFLTDKETDTILDEYSAICHGLHPDERSRILFHRKEPILSDHLRAFSPYVFTDEILVALDYTPINNALIPGSNHFPVLQYFREFPGYDYYWIIEDDVRFTGEWKDLFSHFNAYDHDFITSHIRRFDDEPDWPWWISLSHNGQNIPRRDLLRSFNPIYRLSRRALNFIHDALTQKWIGHHEVLLPTLLNRNHYTLLDFGGEGDFVASGNANKFYTSGQLDRTGSMREGTMRFRPAWTTPGDQKNKLYHPIKPENHRETAAQKEFNRLLYQQMTWGADMYALSLLNQVFQTSYLPFTKFSLRPTCLAMILNDLVINRRTTILEFGTGITTLAIARLIRNNRLGARLFSIEHDESWFRLIAGQLKSERLDDLVELIYAPLIPCRRALDGNHWYDGAILEDRLQGCRPDLVVVDGPPAYKESARRARYPALPFLYGRLAAAFSIYLDDVDRDGEKQVMEKWSAEYTLQFDTSKNTFGYAVRGHHFDPRPF
jgi:hypothetical protein